MKSTTHISTEKVALNHILKNMYIDMVLEFNENHLKVVFDEDKIINILSSIASEYSKFLKSYTGVSMTPVDIDRIFVKIGEYEFSGSPEYEHKSYKHLIGYKKDKQ